MVFLDDNFAIGRARLNYGSYELVHNAKVSGIQRTRKSGGSKQENNVDNHWNDYHHSRRSILLERIQGLPMAKKMHTMNRSRPGSRDPIDRAKAVLGH